MFIRRIETNSRKNIFDTWWSQYGRENHLPISATRVIILSLFIFGKKLMPHTPQKFADKYLLAVEQAIKEKPQGGLDGFEQEWNLLDEELRPLLTVGAGPNQHSFVD